ncbi:MAG: protein kinase [Pseudomonadota bacterium]
MCLERQDSDESRALFLRSDSMVDHFRVVRLVGQGGMGEVYLARDTLLNRRVALKVIHPRYLDSEEAVARFVREAQLTASLSHPHIVTVYAVGKHEGRPYLALEYLEGQNLRQRMDEERPGVRESLRIVLAIAQALVEAHRHRVLHRDLKPENVILAKDGRLRLVDLGLAKVSVAAAPLATTVDGWRGAAKDNVAAEAGELAGHTEGTAERGVAEGKTAADAKGRRADSVAGEGARESAGGSDEANCQATVAGTVKGTPAYMAPEQWRGEESCEATDVWALGVILYELLAGRRPYPEKNVELLGLAVVRPVPVPALVLAPTQDISAELVELVGRCLEKDSARRPSAAQVVDVFDRSLWEGRRQAGTEQSPFRGLFSFAERHADMFFGRDNEIAVFLESLREQAVLPVVGPSGAGKSSFVQAGVVPRLREQGAWTTLAIRPGSDPFGALAVRLVAGESVVRKSETMDSSFRTSALFPSERLRDLAGGEDAWTLLAMSGDEGALAKKLCARPELLGVMLHDLAARQMGKVLLFVDQLEETYTLVGEPAVREAFIRAICRVADHPSSPVRAVFTIRDDFLGRLGGGPEVAAALARVFVLRRPSKEGLEEVLTRPLTAVGYAYDDLSLPSEMVDSVEGEPACLPLLQFAGQMLWERRDKNQRRLLRATYEAMGGVAGSLAEHADGVLAGMTPAQVELARQLLLRLVTSAGTRKVLPVTATVAGLGPGVEEVLERLTQARLLTVRRAADTGRRHSGEGKGSGGETVLELVHESLVRTWRRLARWIEESHEELALLAELGQAAELWEKRGHRDEEVWQGDALADARRKLARLQTRTPELVALFIQAGLRKEQRQRRRKRLLAAGTMAFLAVVAGWSLLQQRATQAQKERAEQREAEAQTQRARAQEGEAEAQREGASASLSRGQLVEARARLRSSLTTPDSLLGRALWWKLHRDPLEWTANLGNIVYDVAYAPDGRSVAAACEDDSVYVVDVDTAETRLLRGGGVFSLAVAYSPDGRYLATGYQDGLVSIWDLATGAPLVLAGHQGEVRRVAISPDGRRLASASADRTVRIWTVPAGKLERVLESTDRVRTVAFSPDGRWLAIAGFEKVIQLYDVRSWTLIRTMAGHTDLVVDVAFSPDGELLASTSKDASLRLWRTDSGEQIGRLGGHSGNPLFLSFSPDGMLLASAIEDRTVRLWDLAHRETYRILTGHGDFAKGVSFSPDGSRIASASYDRTVRLWRVETAGSPGAHAGRSGQDGSGTSMSTGQGHDSAAWGLSFSPDGRSIVSSGADETLRLWEVATGVEERLLHGHDGQADALAFSPDGGLLASGGADRMVRLWEVATGRPIRPLQGHVNWIRGVAFDTNGATLASSSADETIRIWEAATGAEKRKMVGHVDEVHGIAYSPDNRRLASASFDGTLRVWDLATGRVVKTLATGVKQFAVAFSPDGRTLFSNGYDGTVHRWDLASGRGRLLLQRSRTQWAYLSIDPTGRWLAVPAENRALLVGADDGVARTVGRCSGYVNRTAFSPDGSLVSAVTMDGAVRLWLVDRLMPYWRAPVLLQSPLRLFTHRGWTLLDSPNSSGTPAPAPVAVASANWERAVEQRGIYGVTSADGRFLCLQVSGEQLERWDLVADSLVGVESVPGIEGAWAIPGGGCASLASGEIRIHRSRGRPGETTALRLPVAATAASGAAQGTVANTNTVHAAGVPPVIASPGGELLVAVGRRVVVLDLSSDTIGTTNVTKASYPVDSGVTAVTRVGDWLVLGYRQGQIELVSARSDTSRPTHAFKGAPSCAVTRLVAGPAGTLVGGYANGTIVLWTIADGAVLESAKLHGPIQHLLYTGDRMIAASEVGQYLVWDLSALNQGYCELMRQIWQSIPVVWEKGLPVSRRSIPDHRCAAVPKTVD